MTRFSETFRDFAEESIRETKYREVDLRTADPYGYWIVDGIDGYFTSYDLATRAIDQMLFKKSTMPKVEELKEPVITKKISRQVPSADKKVS